MPPREIIFLSDASESMQDLMPVLKDEIGKAIIGLRPIQSFDVVFYEAGTSVAFQRFLLPATPKGKRDAIAWVNDVAAQGKSDPIPAIEMAFKLKPQLIYFLTANANFSDMKGVAATIDHVNSDRKVKINTILFAKRRRRTQETAGIGRLDERYRTLERRYVHMDRRGYHKGFVNA